MVEILNGLARGAFAEIVETRNNDEAAAGAIEDETEVSEIGVRDVLDFWKRTGLPDADHRAASVGFAIKSFDGVRGLRLGERGVDRGENAARNGKEMRREEESRFGQAGVVENFGCMAMRKEVVRLEVFIELGELEILAQFFACSSGAGLAIRDDLRGGIEQASIGKWAHGEDDACGVAAGIGDELSRSEFVRVKLGQAVDGGIEPCGVRRRELVPGLKDSGVAKAECTAEVDDFDAGFEEFRRKFSRHIVRRCEKRGLGAGGQNVFDGQWAKGRATDAAELGRKFREAVSALRVPHEKRCG